MIKLLIGIPYIDRNHKQLSNLFKIINNNKNNIYILDIIIATRKCDKNTIDFAKKECKLIKCNNYRKELEEIRDNDRIVIAGFGCCLINQKLFDIEVKQLKFENHNLFRW